MPVDVRRILVLSDAHFGTPESSINIPACATALVNHIAGCAPWEQIVLTGDLLDVNLSTFTRSIEGGKYDDVPLPLLGFRHFLDGINTAMRSRDSSKGLADVAESWVYVPGNHDYKVWDMLSAKVVCEDVLHSGKPMGTVAIPLKHHTWRGLESFFAGIFRPYNAQDRVVVTYPNHQSVIAGETVVFTHGHYVDPSQTWRNDLQTRIGGASTAEARKKAIRSVFIETAQYQAAANAVSFTKRTRRIFNGLFGPEGLLGSFDRIRKALGAWILRLLFLGETHRGRAISNAMLLNIECYLRYFCELPRMPRWFVFGHTHRQDVARTPNLNIEVYNAGSFYPDRGMPMTFLEIELAPDGPSFKLMCVDNSGAVARVPMPPLIGRAEPRTA